MQREFCERSEVDAILGLRTRILRPCFEAGRLARFPGDLDDTTRHYAARARQHGGVIGCATLMWVELPEIVTGSFPGSSAQGWQLRGMAVDASSQGAGVGSALLSFIEEDLRVGVSTILWCNARLRATGLYERFGMRTLGERFEIEGVGPHVVMAREVL